MSSYIEELRASIAEKRRQLDEIESAKLFPIGGSIDAPAMVKRELLRQIAVDEELLANCARGPGLE
jgi:hypothetical protein